MAWLNTPSAMKTRKNARPKTIIGTKLMSGPIGAPTMKYAANAAPARATGRYAIAPMTKNTTKFRDRTEAARLSTRPTRKSLSAKGAAIDASVIEMYLSNWAGHLAYSCDRSVPRPRNQQISNIIGGATFRQRAWPPRVLAWSVSSYAGANACRASPARIRSRRAGYEQPSLAAHSQQGVLALSRTPRRFARYRCLPSLRGGRDRRPRL